MPSQLPRQPNSEICARLVRALAVETDENGSSSIALSTWRTDENTRRGGGAPCCLTPDRFSAMAGTPGV